MADPTNPVAPTLTPDPLPTVNPTTTDGSDTSAQSTNLPLAPLSAVQPATNEKKRVLIVDDEDDARELFVELFQNTNIYEVSGAVDGNDALAKLEADKYDLVLLDIVMPNKDGVQTLSEIAANKEKYHNPIVVMLTNIGGDIAVEEAMKLGAVGYKLKIDTEPEDLLKYAAEVIRNGGKIPENLPSVPVPPATPII